MFLSSLQQQNLQQLSLSMSCPALPCLLSTRSSMPCSTMTRWISLSNLGRRPGITPSFLQFREMQWCAFLGKWDTPLRYCCFVFQNIQVIEAPTHSGFPEAAFGLPCHTSAGSHRHCGTRGHLPWAAPIRWWQVHPHRYLVPFQIHGWFRCLARILSSGNHGPTNLAKPTLPWAEEKQLSKYICWFMNQTPQIMIIRVFEHQSDKWEQQ